MVRLVHSTTEKKYIISQKELKEKFGLEGNIKKIELYSGCRLGDIAEDVDPDNKRMWSIITSQTETEK